MNQFADSENRNSPNHPMTRWVGDPISTSDEKKAQGQWRAMSCEK
jgi:hypothetical protein